MKGFSRLFICAVLALSLTRCASTSSTNQEGAEPEVSENSGSASDFEDFESESGSESAATSESAPAEQSTASNEELSLEEELNQAEGIETAQNNQEGNIDNAEQAPQGDEFAEFEKQETPPPAEEPAPAPQVAQEEIPAPEVAPMVEPAPEEPPAPDVIADAPAVEAPPAEVPAEAPAVSEAPAAPVQSLVQIKNFRYRANDNGGTLIVEADGPLAYTTRMNPETNQFVIEVPGTKLARKLKRPFNTRDMGGQVGAIDAYQNRGSTTSRIVVQLRPGAGEPVVQAEGNSLLLVASASAQKTGEPAEGQLAVDEGTTEEQQASILSSQSLEEFLAGNTQFYGKKISIETQDMDIREVFRLISEESGVNLVLSDEVKGSVSVKLRQVPWDQALVVIMKSKKLGYTRAGNVLRIAPLTDIRGEEDEAIRVATAKRNQSPLKVRMVPVSYARIEDLVNQVRPFMTERGRVIGDARTSSLVVSDIDENIERVLKLITGIDVPPPQVLIEGKVVEASDRFQRSVGLQWFANGRPFEMGSSSRGPVRGVGNISVVPGVGARSFGLDFSLGTVDILGDLSATLALYEKEDQVKVISSPRVVTLHNETAEINQTTEIPLIQSNNQNGTVTQSVSFKPVRLRLNVTPQITNDGAVIMNVDVSREFAGAVVEEKTQARPINSRAAKTKVLVKNGQTAVIGGIYQSDATEGTTKVPWIADVPVIGWLFKSKSMDKQKNELLIFLTPRILAQAEAQALPSDSPASDF
ncbi:MAG: type IV pilus secretin PilQ [Pseudobdellovibrionaceae bacterium]